LLTVVKLYCTLRSGWLNTS